MERINYIDLIEPIGTGGEAKVMLGVDNQSGYPVAVKILHKSLFKNEKARERFKDQANLILYLNHKNIVKLVDYIEDEEDIYLVMEYIEGDTLEDYINNISGPIPLEIAVPMMLEILSAIEFAHKRKIIHLDIKPSNIMITKKGDIKILDFGISVDLKNKEMSNQIMGSPFYMSPEQIDGKNINLKSDIYSLGITFHQMLTARLPFPTSISREELFNVIKRKPLKRLNEFVPWLTDDVQEVIDIATNKLESLRYLDCKEFSKEISELV
tara:strand:- start:323 stop:1126 length:804 start_codon:yes stop_codon:yes gene_type:complete